MATATPTALIDAIKASGLLDADQLERVAGFQTDEPDIKTLATRIVRDNLLTLYQIQQLLKGRGKRLMLGNYVLMERIGEGGMGQVYKARHRKLSRLSAVKVIRPDLLKQPNVLARFQREARAAAQLSHPNIVAIYDADQDGDNHFLAMEYVAGMDLARMLAERGPLPAWEACEYMRQTAVGLQHAHSRGLIHRDIKPHNLLVMRAETEAETIQRDVAIVPQTVKILDMGLARALAPDQRELGAITHDGVVVGTLDYLSPEQARDARAADHRSDLYSLGCTFYHLLTGKPPFADGDGVGKLIKHQMDPAPPVEGVRSDVPPAMLAVLYRLMAKKPEDRFQTAGEAASALAACLTGAPLPASPPMASVPVHNAPTTALDPGSTPQDLPPTLAIQQMPPVVPRQSWFTWRRKRWLAFTGLAVLLFLVIAALSNRNRDDVGDDGTGDRRDALLQYLPKQTAGVIRVEFAQIAEHPWVKKNLGAALAKLAPPQGGRPGRDPSPLDQVERFAVLVSAQEGAGEVFVAQVRPEAEQFITEKIPLQEVPDGRGGKYRFYAFPELRGILAAQLVFLGDHVIAGSTQRQVLLEMLGERDDKLAPLDRLNALRARIVARDPEDVAWFVLHRDLLDRVTEEPTDKALKKDLDFVRQEVELIHGGLRAGKDMQISIVIHTRTEEGARALARILQGYLGLARLLAGNAELAPAHALLPLLEAGDVTVVGREVRFSSQMSFERLDAEIEKMRKK